MDTLTDGGDEGRARLRKVSGSCQEALIRECPNGETHLIVISSILREANVVN